MYSVSAALGAVPFRSLIVIIVSDLWIAMSHAFIAGLRSCRSCSNECFIIIVLKPKVDYKRSVTD